MQRKNGYLSLLASLLIFCSCSSTLKPTADPTTPFLTHGDALHPWSDRAPFDAVWAAPVETMEAQRAVLTKLYVAPINIDYLNKKQDKSGNWVSSESLAASDVTDYSTYLRKSVIDAISSNKNVKLQIVDQPDNNTLTLAISLVELVPTKVGVNAVTDIAGVAVPGSKLLVDAGVAGAQVASGTISGGTVAIEMRLIAGTTNESLAEAKDREADPTSVLPNYKDFEAYGWSRQTARDWGKELAELFSTSRTTKVGDEIAQVSIVPW